MNSIPRLCAQAQAWGNWQTASPKNVVDAAGIESLSKPPFRELKTRPDN